MQINGKFKIIDSNSKIEKEIYKAFENEVKLLFDKVRYKIQADMINLVVRALSSSPEMMSIQSGKLKADFGLESDPTQSIIYAIANSVQVEFKNFKATSSQVSNVLNIYIQPSDFKNLLSLSDVSTVTELGTILPWLEWLLTVGDAIIIQGYHVEYGANSNSRSGQAIMVPRGIFKVDSSFSGTADNNFISRALDSHAQEIAQILESNL
jgi:hypothetical protein